MAGRAEVGIDATMGTVGAATHLGGLVDLDVLDNNLLQVETLGVGVAFGILEESQQELGALLGPASLGDTPNVGLGATADTATEATERNSLLVFNDVFQELLGLGELHSLQNHGGLMSILEVNTEVLATSLARLGSIFSLERIHHLPVIQEGTIRMGEKDGWLVPS